MGWEATLALPWHVPQKWCLFNDPQRYYVDMRGVRTTMTDAGESGVEISQ